MSLNKKQLKHKYNDQNFNDKFSDLYSLRLLLNNSIFTEQFSISSNLEEAIQLTQEGTTLYEEIISIESKLTPVELKLGIFLRFYDNELLIDVEKTNVDAMIEYINDLIVSKKIIYPWIYDRELYDKFQSTKSIQPKSLSYVDAINLISNTSFGVFQVKKFLVGPFGILKSDVKRYLPPGNMAPLWHCSDPACERVHFVQLGSYSNNITKANIIARFITKDVTDSEWHSFFVENFSGEPEWFDDMHLDRLTTLLVNAFSKKELSCLLERVIERNSKEIRSLFPTKQPYKKIFQGSSAQIVSNLNKSQIFQLLLLVSNEMLVESLEELIDENIIYIPPTELRI